MADTNKQPASEQLREVAKIQENTLLAKNNFQETSKEYSANSIPSEINGAKEERAKLGVMNMFDANSYYKNPDGEGA